MSDSVSEKYLEAQVSGGEKLQYIWLKRKLLKFISPGAMISVI